MFLSAGGLTLETSFCYTKFYCTTLHGHYRWWRATLSSPATQFHQLTQGIEINQPGACFSNVPKLFGLISGATIPFMSSQRRGSQPSNFAILLVLFTLRIWLKISFSKHADCSLTNGFSGPKSTRDFRETGPWALDFTVTDGISSFALHSLVLI